MVFYRLAKQGNVCCNFAHLTGFEFHVISDVDWTSFNFIHIAEPIERCEEMSSVYTADNVHIPNLYIFTNMFISLITQAIQTNC